MVTMVRRRIFGEKSKASSINQYSFDEQSARMMTIRRGDTYDAAAPRRKCGRNVLRLVTWTHNRSLDRSIDRWIEIFFLVLLR
jgi:hypothetical protein